MSENKDYRLIKHLAVLAEAENIPMKMASIVQWKDLEPSLDIRKWEGENPKKGISLRGDEIRKLCMILKSEYPEYFK